VIRCRWNSVSADYALRLIRPTAASAVPLHMHRGADPSDIAEHAQIAIDFRLNAGRLFRIVGQFYGRPSVDRRYLADDRDRIEIDRTIRRAADEIVGQVGAPAETDADTAGEMLVGLLDG